MVGFEPVVQPGHEGMVHHMVLYECHVHGDEEEEEEWFGPHAGGKGERCYSPNMPEEWNFCLATNTWAWVRWRGLPLRLELLLKLQLLPLPV